MRRFFLIILLFIYILPIRAQNYQDSTFSVEDRVKSALGNMTMDEKLSYIGGVDAYYIRDIPRLGIPELKMSDGPVGVRTWGPSTAYPAGICNAATWDRNLVQQLGTALGKDARARGVHILLGPGLNIYRAPMCGRNFEYFGEDPYLSGQMAVQFIDGVQSEHVVATAKHFVANNQEWNRFEVSSDIDERTLHEIYLPAFRAAVEQAHVGAVMNAYNLLNDEYCTQNDHLNNDILKGQWGFKGVLMSDWGATHDGIAAATAGLDLEMPSAQYMSPSTISDALKNGKVTNAMLDDKVSRILRMIFTFGFYDHPQTDASIPLDDPDNDSVALNLAREGIVLLKNDSILPFSLNKIKSLAVIGPNSDDYVAGGGSSYTTPFHYVSVAQGISDLAGGKLKINLSGALSYDYFAKKSFFYASPGSGIKGLTGEYFSNQNLSGDPVGVRIDSVIDFQWPDAVGITGMPADHFSVRWTGVIRPDTSAVYTFYGSADDGFRLWVDDNEIINNWTDITTNTVSAKFSMTAGKEYSVKLEYYDNTGPAQVSLGYEAAGGIYKEVYEAASASDAAILCLGFNSLSEGEGSDRPFTLDNLQDSLLNLVTSVNSNTVVILNAGGNVEMQSWIGKVRGLIHAWYPGQEGGKALAEILFGQTNPSGKLPVTFEKQWKDNPVYMNYYANNGPRDIQYNEGLFVGYRYYDSYHVSPMFPFGFGLSYTTFEYSDLAVTKDTMDQYKVSFKIKNTGKRAGAEVAQLYVGQENPVITNPVKELKDFARVFLQAGEVKTVTMNLGREAFEYFNVDRNAWAVDKGNYDIIIGASSEDERLRNTVTIDKDTVITALRKSYRENGTISIFPVPADNYLVIQSGSGTLVSLWICGLDGKIYDHKNLKGNQFEYDCRSIPDGIYLYKVITGRQVFTGKFIICHK